MDLHHYLPDLNEDQSSKFDELQREFCDFVERSSCHCEVCEGAATALGEVIESYIPKWTTDLEFRKRLAKSYGHQLVTKLKQSGYTLTPLQVPPGLKN